MSSTNGTSPPPELPNPYTPLAFFPPDVAYQVSVSIYTLVAALVASISVFFSSSFFLSSILTGLVFLLPSLLSFFFSDYDLGHVEQYQCGL